MNGRPLPEQIARAQSWLANGYKPVPCLRHDAPDFVERRDKSGKLVKVKNSPGKQPQGWLWKRKDTAVYGATPDSIEGWRRLRGIGEYPNLGIACGWTVAPDIDVYEAALASATEALVREHLGDTPLRRTGREPKLLLLYRAATEPLNKAATALFVNDSGQTAQLEIMGQGQQIVAHGMHPCGTPYTWGDASPDDTPLAELPAVTADQVALLIADAETLFLEHGYRPKGIEPPREAAAPSPSPKPRGTADPAGGPFRAVNDAAMADLGRWVPQLFGDDARDDRRGGYRVSSAALGRDREEDISISPKGIVDFGEHDMGDANLGKRTPIDLVIEHGNAADAAAAAKWLAGLTGTEFELPRHRRHANGEDHDTAEGYAADSGATRRTERDSSGQEKTAGPGKKPVLLMVAGRRDQNVALCIATVNKADVALSVFSRGNIPVVVRIAIEDEVREKKSAGGKITSIVHRKGAAVIRTAEADHVLYALDHLLEGRRFKQNGETVPADPTAALAKLVVRNGAFRELLKITRTPTLRADGSILATPGYDPASALIYLPDAAYPAVKARPTHADAKDALARLERPFRDVSFVSDTDRAVFLALILTLFTRHLYNCSPGFVHRAAEAGTGKTLIADAACVIATGVPASNAAAVVLDDPPELRKLLTTWVGAGVALGMFDNMPRGAALDSPTINRFLTAPMYSDRWLGGNDELKARVATVIVATGNRVEVKGDATRRFLVVDLDAGVEHPEDREFDFILMEEIERDRVELVVSALTLLRAYVVAGQPMPDACQVPFGSFEAWSERVRQPLVWAGAADPVGALTKSRQDDEERTTLESVIGALRGACGLGAYFTAGEAIAKANSGSFDVLKEAINVPDVAEGKKTPALSAKRLGRYLKANQKRVVAGFWVVYDYDQDTKAGRYMVLGAAP